MVKKFSFKKMLGLGFLAGSIFTASQLYKTSEEVIEKPSQVQMEYVQNLIDQLTSKSAKDNRDIYWEQIGDYKGSKVYDLTVPFYRLKSYVYAEKISTQKVSFRKR